MTRRRHSFNPWGLFFATTSTFDHAVMFTRPEHYRLVMEKIELYRIRDEASIHAYVIMPHHFHLLINIPHGKSISAYMRDLKKLTARDYRRVNRIAPARFWQRRFDDFDIVTEKTYYTKFNYIHQNPVRAGLVGSPEDWAYSSAGYFARGEQGIITVTPAQ
jgi:putative transposase